MRNILRSCFSPLFGSLVICALIQIAAATWWVDDFESPNSATGTALTLAQQGEYSNNSVGNAGMPGAVPYRMFHQPGEVLYQAAGFKTLPPVLWRFLHLPIVLLMVSSIAWCARHFFGSIAATITVMLASIHPYMVLHGPVWDDAFTAAALEWFATALLLQLTRVSRRHRAFWPLCVLLLIAAGAAAVTRPQSLGIFSALVLASWVIPSLKLLRLPLCMAMIGMILTTGSWVWRNQVISQQWIIGSTHDGSTLWESTYPHALEALLATGQASDLNYLYMHEEDTATQAMREWEADRYYRQRAFNYIRSNPFQVLGVGLVKLAVTFSGMKPELSILGLRNAVALLVNVLMLASLLYVARVVDWQRWTTDKTYFALFGLASLAGVLVLGLLGPAGWRYRVDLEGFGLMAAALSLRSLFDRHQSRRSQFKSFGS